MITITRVSPWMVTHASRVDTRWSPHSWLLTVGRSGERFHVAKILLIDDDAIARMILSNS
jgi:hypothetical protein